MGPGSLPDEEIVKVASADDPVLPLLFPEAAIDFVRVSGARRCASCSFIKDLV